MNDMSPLPRVPQRKLYRLYNIRFLAGNGDERQIERKLPARPAFEKACTAMARGTLVQTPDGPKAIEDLSPGQRVQTPNGPAKIMWIGSTVMIPHSSEFGDSALTALVRVQTSTLFQGVHGDLILGPLARIFRPLPDARDHRAMQAKDPLDAFGDGIVFPIQPVGPVRMFQVMLDQGTALNAQGIAIETLCPDHLQDFASNEDWQLLGQLFASAPSMINALRW